MPTICHDLAIVGFLIYENHGGVENVLIFAVD